MRYDFRCLECGEMFEGDKKLDAKNPKCKACEGETEIVILKRPTIFYKGVGFHKNDYNAWEPYNK